MNLEIMAGLGAHRAPGESLASWLRAGPLPLVAWTGEPVDRRASHLFLYCPCCRVKRSCRARYYSRAEWQDPRRVVCATHCVPLVRCAVPPKHIEVPRLGREVKFQLEQLARWIEVWILLSPATFVGRPIFASHCLQDQILRALTEQEERAQTFSIACWRLWLEGWPLPSHPRGNPAFLVGEMKSQADRLALVATTWKVWACLVGTQTALWPALPIDPKSLLRLQRALVKTWSYIAHRLPIVLTPDDQSVLGKPLTDK